MMSLLLCVLFILLSRLVVALLQLRHHPGIELLTPRQLRPIVHPQSAQSCLGKCRFLLSRNKANSVLFTRTHCSHGFFQQVLRVDLLTCAKLHDLVLESHCAKINLPTCLATSLRQQDVSAACLVPSAPSSRLASSCSSLSQSFFRVQLTVLFHHHCCDVLKWLSPSSRHRLSYLNLGFTPSSRIAHRTGNEAQFLLVLVHIHFHFIRLARLAFLRCMQPTLFAPLASTPQLCR